MTPARVVLVPGVLALLPEYASLDDPVAELRSTCRAAVAWLVEAGPVTIVGDQQGRRVGKSLVAEVAPGAGVYFETVAGRPPQHKCQGAFTPQPPDSGTPQPPEGEGVLVVGNGSACRSERAPGYLDERAAGFDAVLARALTAPDPAALSAIDPATSAELLAATDGIRSLGDVLTPDHLSTVDYDDDPYGVQYWVIRWDARLP
ncbi:MAG: hypothetical protein ACJ72P_17485 [Nocardioides sp.]